MKALAFLVVLVLVSLGTPAAAQRVLHQRVVTVNALQMQRVEIPDGYTTIVIDEIRVTNRRAANPGIVIRMRTDRRYQESAVNVQINRISGVTDIPFPFTVRFENIRIRNLSIYGEPAQATTPGPVIDLRFEEKASAANVLLNGGRYEEINVLFARNWDADEEEDGRANITTNGITFQTLFLRGYNAIVPIELSIDGTPIAPEAHGGRNRIMLQLLQVLRGSVRLHRPEPAAGSLPPSLSTLCEDNDRRLILTLSNVNVGLVTDPTMLIRDDNGGLSISSSYQPCIELNIDQVDSDRVLEISNHGGVFGSVTIDGLMGMPDRGDVFRLRGNAISSLSMVRASVDRFEILTTDQEIIGNPRLPTWGSLEAAGLVQLPEQVYDSLDATLREHGHGESATLSGMRTFLVNNRWRSYIANSNGPAASRTLYIVLSNDARNIYGWRLAGLIDWFTGFGIKLGKPMFSAILYLFLPVLTVTLFKGRRKFSTVGNYLGQLFLGRTPTPGSLPEWTRAAMQVQRALFFLQVTLVSLFIQNTVLVGP